MRFILLSILLVLSWSIVAQKQNLQQNYIPFACDSGSFAHYFELTTQRYESDLASVKSKPKAYREDLSNMYYRRYKAIKKYYQWPLVYSDKQLNDYFQHILKTILDANPQVPQDIRLLISRDPVPNAVCYGEGTIIIYLEFMRWMDNESQLAFALCHEIAHYYANHNENSINDAVYGMHDPAYQKKLKDIYKSEYNTYAQALELVKQFSYSTSKHSRLHESEADSIAVMLMRNTPYSELEALTTLEIMDSMDAEKFDTLNWAAIFNFPDYPFQTSWLKKESGLSRIATKRKMSVVDEDGFDSDSLKTHPDCQVRIGLLKNIVKDDPTKKRFVQSEELFNSYKEYSKFERLNNVYYAEYYDAAIFLSMQMLQEYPDNAYLYGILGSSWYNIYIAQQEHRFNRHVRLPGNYEEYSFSELLDILNNLRMSQIGKIGFNLLKARQDIAAMDENLLYSYMQLCKIEGNMELYVSLQNKYKREFPEGKYISQL